MHALTREMMYALQYNLSLHWTFSSCSGRRPLERQGDFDEEVLWRKRQELHKGRSVRVKVQLNFPWQQDLAEVLVNCFRWQFPDVTLRKGGRQNYWIALLPQDPVCVVSGAAQWCERGQESAERYCWFVKTCWRVGQAAWLCLVYLQA